MENVTPIRKPTYDELTDELEAAYTEIMHLKIELEGIEDTNEDYYKLLDDLSALVGE